MSTVCPLQDHRETHLRSCRTNHWPISLLPQEQAGFSTREVDRKSGHPADTRCWGCVSAKAGSVFVDLTAASTASYSDCFLTGTWSAWSWSWLAIAGSPLPQIKTNGAGYDALRMASHRDPSWHPFSSTPTSLTCQPPSPENMHTPTT